MKFKTLLLDVGFQPLKPISWKRAVILTFLNKVDVLETYPFTISAPNVAYPAPAVVRLRSQTSKKMKPMRIRFSRENIYIRDQHTCQYCGEKGKELTLDHVVPKSMGGKTNWTNIVSCCKPCNEFKADRTPHQANMKLLKKPTYPSVVEFYTKHIGNKIPEEWQNWIY